MPGAELIRKKDLYDIIILFIGGNNLFATKSERLVRQMSDLANLLLTKAKRVFVLGIPPRNFQPLQEKDVTFSLASCQEGCKFRGISRQVFSNKHSRKDNVHLNSYGLSGITFILKKRYFTSDIAQRLKGMDISKLLCVVGFASTFPGQISFNIVRKLSIKPS